MWGLHNANDVDIDGPQAWDREKGDPSVIVAVIDTGIWIDHPDLAGNFVAGWDFYNHDSTVYDGLDDDHGTHVAGTILANWNSEGVAGIAPGVKIMPLKFLGPAGGWTSGAIEAIEYAKAHGADLINASWGGGGYSQSLEEAIDNFGGPFVAAAGNDGVDTDRAPHYPSSYDCGNIISVAAVDRYGALAYFSNYGDGTVDVAAPGVGILSTVPGRNPNRWYASYNGTSMATPHVTGVAALMLSADPDLGTQDLTEALYSSVKPLGSLSEKTATGGMVSAYGALKALGAPAPDTTPPVMTATLPENGASGVSLDAAVKVVFDEPIQVAGSHGVTVNDGSVEANASGSDLVIVTSLAYGTRYTVSVPAGSVLDLAGNANESLVEFTFTTESEPAPQPETLDILRTKPRDGSVNVKTDATVEIYFSSAFTLIDASKIAFDGPAVSFDASGAGGSVLKVDPAGSLDPKTAYTLILSEGAVSAGDAVSPLYQLTFTTGK